MSTDVSSVSALRRPSKFRVRELCGSLDLEALERDGPLATGLANVRYWLSYEQGSLQHLLMQTPSPLMELGTAVALQFSEDVTGEITQESIDLARTQWLPELDDGPRQLLEQALDVWSRTLLARAARSRWHHEGFKSTPASSGISLKDLEAIGHADIHVELEGEGSRRMASLNQVVTARAYDSKGRPLPKIDVEHPMAAEVLIREHAESGGRDFVFWIPGAYRLRVPSRATGEVTLVVG